MDETRSNVKGIQVSRHRRYLAVVICFVALAPGLHAQATLASAKPPGYPLAAKAAGIDGPVVLQCTITKEGKVQNLRVVNGPPELRQAAMDAVSNWTYHPYRHFGHLVEVNTTITVNFNRGTGQKKLEEQAKAQAEIAKSGLQTTSQEAGTISGPQQ